MISCDVWFTVETRINAHRATWKKHLNIYNLIFFSFVRHINFIRFGCCISRSVHLPLNSLYMYCTTSSSCLKVGQVLDRVYYLWRINSALKSNVIPQRKWKSLVVRNALFLPYIGMYNVSEQSKCVIREV